MIKKNLENLFLIVLFLLMSFSIILSCDTITPDPIESLGRWSDSSYSNLDITETSYIVYDSIDFSTISWSFEIISYSNDSWNGGDIGVGNFGYALLKYTNPPSWATSEKDKYTILRWKNLTETTMDYSEAYCSGGTTYYITEAEAIANVTNANNCFATFTSVSHNITPAPIESLGRWSDGSYTNIDITEALYNVYETADFSTISWGFEIVSYSNDSWNGGDTGVGNFGYALLKYTNPPSWATSEKDKYTILRWKNLTETTMDYSEAYCSGGTTYYITEAEALANVTNANGCFAIFSPVTKQN